MTNPILKEIHDIRKQILTEHGDDPGVYLRSELEKTKASGHPVAKIKQRTSGSGRPEQAAGFRHTKAFGFVDRLTLFSPLVRAA